jgi:hypothetical protein
MNRRGFMAALTGAAAALGVGKLPLPAIEAAGVDYANQLADVWVRYRTEAETIPVSIEMYGRTIQYDMQWTWIYRDSSDGRTDKWNCETQEWIPV